MKLQLLFAILLAAAVATPCYNDSDTNLTELRDNLDITYAIAGRFTIYPPEYYKRRIEIQTANLKKNPNDLNAFDNLAVAYDRIGKHDEAIATIRKERKLIESGKVNPLTEVKDELVPEAPPVNHRYTVEANEGTFLIHRWITKGGNSDLTDAIEAERRIAKAIEINPDAHFGREFAQLYCMRAILKGAKEGDWKQNFSENLIAIADRDRVDHKALRKGIAGMMVLGNAWNSPVMLEAVAELVPTDIDVRLFVGLRSAEINGYIKPTEYKKAIWGFKKDPKVEHYTYGFKGVPTKFYDRDAQVLGDIRLNAIEFQAKRRTWISNQLSKKTHPDTDANFWLGLKDLAPIDKAQYHLQTPPRTQLPLLKRIDWGAVWLGFVVLLGFGWVGKRAISQN